MDPASRIIKLENANYEMIRNLDRKRTLVMATFSPLEVHGPHLPIGQDWFEAAALANATAEALAAERPEWTILSLPPIPIAADCTPYVGSVNFSPTLVRDVAYNALLPFAEHGFARLAISSFHGGPRHIIALEDAADKITRKFDVTAASIFSVVVARMTEGNVFYDAVMETIKDAPENNITLDQISQDWHAGFVETSLALHLWPELVGDGWQSLPACTKGMEFKDAKVRPSFMGEAKSKADPIGEIKKITTMVQNFGQTIGYFKKHTYAGFPAMASAEAGRLIFERLVREVKDIMSEFLDRGGEMNLHSPLWKLRGVLLSPVVNSFLSDVLGASNM